MVKTWRYSVPTLNGVEGWAVLFLDDVCCFAALSDYGDYCYRWSPAGMPEHKNFRQFLVNCGEHYLLHKLAPKEEYDQGKTLTVVKKRILEDRRKGRWDAEAARNLWKELDYYSNLHDESDFREWIRQTESYLPEAFDLSRSSPPQQATMFMRHCWPRLKELIRSDLEKEVVRGV